MDIKKYLQEKKEVVDSSLERYFPEEMEAPIALCKAIRHSLFAGGKRIRPILSMAAFEAVGGKGEVILPFACALEMIHTYSLIHDDLPAIDNDDYRRGKPTCHKVFGEANAILAGDALLTEAFRLMTSRAAWDHLLCSERVVLDIIHKIAQAAGISGMVGGQVIDIESEGKDVDLPTLLYIHTHKTGAMILVSIQIGAMLGGAEGDTLKAFTDYGERVGLAFQIADDILDVEGTAELLGKNTGSDLSKRKATYPSLLGLAESKKRAKELAELAVGALSTFGTEAGPLREIARFIVAREN
ncbi:MAG: polyprenyl synthetase family protein [Deltaproteobacteria bacterium]|nr:polyprenyl synthetase family protein [Deltaproteobacteria bacterium]MBW2306409.1 polyprenyl synthetase family protein [Deltaproteobacteria bacterium]